MKALARSLLSLLFLTGLVVGVLAAVLHPLSGQRHLTLVRVTERAGPPAPPAGRPQPPPVPTLTVQHQVIGVNDGRLLLGSYPADDEARAVLHLPAANPARLPLGAGLHYLAGPATQPLFANGPYSRQGPDTFSLQLPLFWLAVGGLSIAVVGYGSRSLYHHFTTQRIPSSVCLHCNQHYEDPAATQCPHCGALRPRVTVTKSGRPL